MSVIILVLIALFVAASSFVSSTGKVIDRRRKHFKYITNRGWVIICLNLIVVILSVAQYRLNERELGEKERINESRQHIRDSILKAGYDSSLLILKDKFDTSNLKTVSVVSQTLGKYGYLLDSSNKELKKIIRDSSKTKVYVQEDPILTLCVQNGIVLKELKNGFNNFSLSICSEGAGSTDFNLDCQVIFADSLTKFTYVGRIDPLAKSTQIPKENIITSFFSVTDNIKSDFLYIWIKGTYKNIDKTKEYSIDNLYYYNYKGKTYGLVNGKTRDEALNFIKGYLKR